MGTETASVNTIQRALAAVTLVPLLSVCCVSSVAAFTRVQAIDLQRRLAYLEKLDNPEGGNLFTVAREMNRVTRSSFGPSPVDFSDTVMLRMEGSFGEGRDYGSLDFVSVKDVGYGEMLEGGLPLFTFQKDHNPGIVANFKRSDRDGLDLSDVQFTEMVGSAPVFATSYIIGGIILATAGVAVVAASSGGSDSGQGPTQTPSPSSQTPTSSPSPPGTTSPSPPASSPQGASSQPPANPDQPGAPPTGQEPEPEPDTKDKDNNRDGEKNQPSGEGTGFTDAHDKKDKKIKD